MPKKIAIHQGQYLPWPPYLKKLAAADEFIWMDCVQYQRRGVQNRNRIRNDQKAFWLTVPVSGERTDRIRDIRVAEDKWQRKHWASIQRAYANAPYWSEFKEPLEALYRNRYSYLDDVNWAFLHFLTDVLSIETPVIRLSELAVEGQKSDLILNTCKARSASIYLSGQGAKDYLDEPAFHRAGIDIQYMASEPPVYRQIHGNFIEGLSVIDMLLNVGPQAIREWLDLEPGSTISERQGEASR